MDVSITLNDDIGNTKLHHTFNGAAPVGRGYMICNGDIINSTNYDAIHGSGAYTRDNVATSPVVGKYTPNMVDKFAVGAASTAQVGSSAITSVGLVGHILATANHLHKWYDSTAVNVADTSFDASGNSATIHGKNKSTGGHIVTSSASTPGEVTSGPLDHLYTNLGGSVSQTIKPESIEFLYIIKVI